jgi:DNA-binding response OmpR family regulator
VKPVKHILVVDDEAPVRLLLEKILQSAGYRVTSVPDGMAALKAAREDTPDLAISDLSMPGIDGFTLCSTLRRSKMFKAPILILSGRISEKDREDALRAGADAFIPKPVEREKLLAKVAEWLAISEKRVAEDSDLHSRT